MSAGKICGMCKKPAEYYDVALPVEEFFFYCGDHSLLEDLDPDDFLNQHTLTGAYVSRRAAFPECMDIEELFAKTPRAALSGRPHTLQMWASVVNANHIQQWDVVARPAVVGWIQENSIYTTPLDANHYIQITCREDEDLAFITLKFQQILGSRLLAIVPLKTVEKFFGVKAP